VVLLPRDAGSWVFFLTDPADSPSSSWQTTSFGPACLPPGGRGGALAASPHRHPPPDPAVPHPELLYVRPDRRIGQPRNLIQGAAATVDTNPSSEDVAVTPLPHCASRPASVLHHRILGCRRLLLPLLPLPPPPVRDSDMDESESRRSRGGRYCTLCSPERARWAENIATGILLSCHMYKFNGRNEGDGDLSR
jgi:hypothetical protein